MPFAWPEPSSALFLDAFAGLLPLSSSCLGADGAAHSILQGKRQMKIIEALKAVRGETNASVDTMIQILAANDFDADDPADGAFRSLSESLLLGMHFTPRQVAAIFEAQRVVTRSGAEVGAIGMAAELPQVEYLQQPMKSMKHIPGQTSSSSTYLDGRYEYELSFWDLEQDVAEIETFLASSLGGKTVRKMLATDPAELRRIFTSEPQTNTLFLNDVCERINNIYAANNVPLAWMLGASSERDFLKPDFRLLRRGVGDDVMVGEGKFSSVLDNPLLFKLAEALKNHEQRIRRSYLAAVNQICTYMDVRRLRYGFLTSYNLTFFFKRLGDKQYAMTDGMERGETKPSVAAVLYYLSEKSRQEGPVTAPVASLSPVPALLTSSLGPQQQGSGQHGQGGGAGTSHSMPGAGAGSDRPSKAPRLEEQRGCSLQLHYPEDDGVSCSRGPRNAAKMSEHAPGAGASCSRGAAASIPEHALVLGGRLGWGLGGVVHCGRVYGQEVAVKGADACNSRDVVQCLRHEGTVLSGRLQSLQGVCVPVLHAYGYWEGRLMFVLATAIINGRHPQPGESYSPAVLANAEQALSEIHARGVAHGDICEQNILITHDDKVFFIDFGASVLDPSPKLCATEMQELHRIFAALGSPSSDKTTHQGS